MTLTLTGLLLLLIIAGICGAIGRSLGGGARGGFLISVVVGFLGALFGVLLARNLHLPELLSVNVDGKPFPILWSILGGALLVALLNLLSGATVGGRGRWRYR
ncbi:MAG: hypothetical protein RL033_4485 [Pseudomonadota bacterium]|jgi:uncharacterized membrane protein YeaQ/YmgE (transglycosylase-associated protein family)